MRYGSDWVFMRETLSLADILMRLGQIGFSWGNIKLSCYPNEIWVRWGFHGGTSSLAAILMRYGSDGVFMGKTTTKLKTTKKRNNYHKPNLDENFHPCHENWLVEGYFNTAHTQHEVYILHRHVLILATHLHNPYISHQHPSHTSEISHFIPQTSHPSYFMFLTLYILHTSQPSHLPIPHTKQYLHFTRQSSMLC